MDEKIKKQVQLTAEQAECIRKIVMEQIAKDPTLLVENFQLVTPEFNIVLSLS